MRKTPGNHTFAFGLVAFCAVVSVSPGIGHAADSAHSGQPSKSAVGVCTGVPQTVAVTYERSLGPHLAARVHVGSAVFFSSAGGRLQWQSTGPGLKPYFFAGAALIHSVAEGYGDPEGTTAYLWLGPGVNLNLDRWVIFAEVCALQGGDDDKGLGDDWVFPFSPAIAGGIMVRL